jgi:hypothetical protein
VALFQSGTGRLCGSNCRQYFAPSERSTLALFTQGFAALHPGLSSLTASR